MSSKAPPPTTPPLYPQGGKRRRCRSRDLHEVKNCKLVLWKLPVTLYRFKDLWFFYISPLLIQPECSTSATILHKRTLDEQATRNPICAGFYVCSTTIFTTNCPVLIKFSIADVGFLFYESTIYGRVIFVSLDLTQTVRLHHDCRTQNAVKI